MNRYKFPGKGFNRSIYISLFILTVLFVNENSNQLAAQVTTNIDTFYVTAGTSVFIGDNFINSSNGVVIDQGELLLAGNWSNSGAFVPGAGNVTFMGSGQQDITSTTVEMFANLTIANSSSTGLYLNSPIEVAGLLTLTDGVVYTSDANILTIADYAYSTSGSSASHVDGPMRKIGKQAFVFPLGDNNVWARLSISAPLLSSDEFKAEYIFNGFGNYNVSWPLNNASQIEYWLLERTGTSNVKVGLYWEDVGRSGILDCDDLTIAHWTGANYWEEQEAEAYGSCTGLGNGVIQTEDPVSSFSPFTFGSRGTSNPLPIMLLDFTAHLKEEEVQLKWTTLSEQNNDFFSVERSRDGELYNELLVVDGAGNSSEPLDYFTVDENPLQGTSYYRLKQTDVDGGYTFSAPVIIKRNPGIVNMMSIHPTLVSEQFSITFEIQEALLVPLEIRLIDAMGKVVLSTLSDELYKGIHQENVNVQSLRNGIYFVHLIGVDKIETGKIVVIH